MPVTRRQFVNGAMATVAVAATPLSVTAQVKGANEQIRVGAIGAGGRGATICQWTLSEGKGQTKIVAVADPDLRRAEGRANEYGKKSGLEAEAVKDFRRLLDRDDIDVVNVTTCNHAHTICALLAVQSGKDVYCEKPVSHNVWEGRQLVNAARKHKQIVQTGTQSRGNAGMKEMVQYIHGGELGAVKAVVGTCYKSRGPIGQRDTPLEIPEHVDYDLWCGPAEKRELFRNNLHYDWHWDFNTGNGDLGNQGIHQMDLARWFLGAEALSPRVMSIGGRFAYEDASDTPNTQVVFHDYEKAPIIFEVRGLPKNKQHLEGGDWGRYRDTYLGAIIGVVVHCENGYLVVGSYASGTAYDHAGNKVKSFRGGGAHYGNFLDAVKSRKHTDLDADIEQGHLSSALCHTGNVSYRLGRKASADEIAQALQGKVRFSESWGRMASHLAALGIDLASKNVTLGPWLEMDPKTEVFTAADGGAETLAAANKLLSREYRKPFVVPAIDYAAS